MRNTIGSNNKINNLVTLILFNNIEYSAEAEEWLNTGKLKHFANGLNNSHANASYIRSISYVYNITTYICTIAAHIEDAYVNGVLINVISMTDW